MKACEFLTENKQRPPTVGYHVTYLDRWESIKKRGLKRDMPPKQCTGLCSESRMVYLINSPKLAHWAGNDRTLNRDKPWVLLKITNLKKELLRADGDYSNDLDNFLDWQTSLEIAGTFAYAEDIPPNQISIAAIADSKPGYRHDEFEELR